MSQPELPRSGRLAGIDYGTVRLGIALCDSRQTLASPWENYTRQGAEQDAAWFRRLVADEQVVGFVVGLPVHLDGHESQKSTESRTFGRWLGETTGVPVGFYDERFTTHEATAALSAAGFTKKGRKARLDKLAAQILLASFLESRDREQAAVRGLDGPG